MAKNSSLLLAATLLLLVLASCGKSSQNDATTQRGVDAPSPALAFVGKSAVTTEEFEFAKSRYNINGALLDARFDDTLLKSLVSSRAMSQLASKEMDHDSSHALDLKVAAYREELLVKEYLKKHANPVPVSETQVREYYDKHPEELSGGSKKEFEYFISTAGDLNEEQRKRVLAFISSARSADKWVGLLDGNKDLHVTYRKAKARTSVLEEPLKTLVSTTASGSVSSVHMGKQIVIVRVLGEETIPARPLAEVSAEIRKRLAPMQLRKAVKEVSALALTQVEVTYPGQQKDN